MRELLRRDGRVWRVGHRGAAALAPENTLRSFESAVEVGVDVLEFDVLDLHDGTLVLAHSDDLFEVSHGAAAGRVRALTLDELRSVAPELPTFEEALAFLAERIPDVGLQVDLKWHGYEQEVVDALRRRGALGRTLVSSFHGHSLLRVRQLEPGLRVGLTYPEDRYGLARRRALAPLVLGGLAGMRRALPRRIVRWLDRCGAAAAMLNYYVVSRAVVERCHERGKAVFVWTVNEPELIKTFVGLGVDGVITDDPRLFRATLSP